MTADKRRADVAPAGFLSPAKRGNRRGCSAAYKDMNGKAKLTFEPLNENGTAMTRQQYINRTLRALTGEKRPATPWQYHHTCRMAEAVSTVYRFDGE